MLRIATRAAKTTQSKNLCILIRVRCSRSRLAKRVARTYTRLSGGLIESTSNARLVYFVKVDASEVSNTNRQMHSYSAKLKIVCASRTLDPKLCFPNTDLSLEPQKKATNLKKGIHEPNHIEGASR